MSKRPQDTSAEEPDGGNPHIRFRGGPRQGDRPGLLNNKTVTIVRAIAICTAAAVGQSAYAAGYSPDQSVASVTRTYVVRFHDLDLSRMDGAAALYSRIRGAARIVCEPLDSRDIGFSAGYRICMEGAIADAVRRVNRPLLSQYHQWRTKGASPVQLAQAN